MVLSRDCYNDYNEPFLAIISLGRRAPSKAFWFHIYSRLHWQCTSLCPNGRWSVASFTIEPLFQTIACVYESYTAVTVNEATQMNKCKRRIKQEPPPCLCHCHCLCLCLWMARPSLLLTDDPLRPVPRWHSGGHTSTDGSIFYPSYQLYFLRNDPLHGPVD